MVKQAASNKWKTVNLEGPIVSGDLHGLIGIEELTDYDLNLIKTGKSKKRKSTCDDEGKQKTNLKVQKTKTKIIINKPGAFVRHPNFISNNKVNENKAKSIIKLKSANQIERTGNNASINNNEIEVNTNVKPKTNKVKKKVEIGQTASNDHVDKCSVADMRAWNSFALSDPLLQGIADLGFRKPTLIQELVLPPAILGRRDILGAAETGSGKTLAFGLPILAGILKLKELAQRKQSSLEITHFSTNVNKTKNKRKGEIEELNSEDNEDTGESDSEESDFDDEENEMNKSDMRCVKLINNIEIKDNIRNPLKPLYALILTPTRELAIQIKNHLIAAAKYTDIHIAVILGGMAAVKQERILKKGPEIVVATPGRLWELIQEGNPHLSQVDNIRFLAIDETDRMIEKGHFQELQQLLERLNFDEIKQKLRQNFVFSATLTLVHDLPHYLVKKKKLKSTSKIMKLSPGQKLQQIIERLGITNPKVIDITQKTGTASSLTECRITCAFSEKDYYVYYFLQQHPGRTLIFCNSIGCVKRLATLLNLLGSCSLPLHACMQQRQRLKNLERFRDNTRGVLVATDVAARGLDIPKVEHVLHYQTPRTSEGYVHRSGRTARALEEGITVLLIEPSEIKSYLKLCQNLRRTRDLPTFPVQESVLTAVKTRVNLARDLERLELQLKRFKSETSWLQKAANDMDIIVDETEFPQGRKNQEEMKKLQRLLTLKRNELMTLVAKPIFPKGFSVKYPTSELNVALVPDEQSTQKAVDVMKDSLASSAKSKKKKSFNRNKRFKKKTKIASNV